MLLPYLHLKQIEIVKTGASVVAQLLKALPAMPESCMTASSICDCSTCHPSNYECIWRSSRRQPKPRTWISVTRMGDAEGVTSPGVGPGQPWMLHHLGTKLADAWSPSLPLCNFQIHEWMNEWIFFNKIAETRQNYSLFNYSSWQCFVKILILHICWKKKNSTK